MNLLIGLSFDWTKRFFSRVKNCFAFLIGQCALRNEFFTWVKSIRKTQYLYNKLYFETQILSNFALKVRSSLPRLLGDLASFTVRIVRGGGGRQPAHNDNIFNLYKTYDRKNFCKLQYLYQISNIVNSQVFNICIV